MKGTADTEFSFGHPILKEMKDTASNFQCGLCKSWQPTEIDIMLEWKQLI